MEFFCLSFVSTGVHKQERGTYLEEGGYGSRAIDNEGNSLSPSELLAFRLVAIAVDLSIRFEESFWHYPNMCCSHRNPQLKTTGHRRGLDVSSI